MKKFSNTRLWDIFRNPAFVQTGKHDFTVVLDEFVDELHIYCRHETKIAERCIAKRFESEEMTRKSQQFGR